MLIAAFVLYSRGVWCVCDPCVHVEVREQSSLGSLLTVWALRIELRFPDLAAAPLPTEPSQQPEWWLRQRVLPGMYRPHTGRAWALLLSGLWKEV